MRFVFPPLIVASASTWLNLNSPYSRVLQVRFRSPVIKGLLQQVPQQLQVVLAPLIGDGPRALPLGDLVPLDPAVAREAVKVLARIDALVEGLEDRGRRSDALRRHAHGGPGGGGGTLGKRSRGLTMSDQK